MSLNSQLSFGVSSALITDGTIVNADISASAAIANSKIAGLAASATTDTTNAANIGSGTLPAARLPALTGDITTTAGAVGTTLATVNSNVGAFGSASAVPVITVNAKGQITAVSTAAISAGSDTLATVTARGASTSTALTLSGQLTVSAAMGDGTAALRLSPASSSGTFQWASTAISASLGAGQTMSHMIGNALSAGNSGYLGFNYTGAASASNYVSLGHYANDNILRVYYGTYTQSLGSMRAPLFYDSDNTAYYVDAAGTSSFSILGVAGHIDLTSHLYLRANLHLLNTAANGWNTVIDRSGGDGWIVYGGNSVRAPIFYDSGNTAYYVDPASASNIGSWTSTSNINVQTGSAGSVYQQITNTDAAGTYAYLQLTASGASSGYLIKNRTTGNSMTNQSLYLWNESGPIEFAPAGSQTLRTTISTGGSMTVATDVRAPIFYDSNDTGFYVDPNSTSRFVSTIVGGHGGTVFDTASNGRLYIGTNSDAAYSIYTTLENVGGNYTKLTFDWHTGIRIGAYWGYGGTRFYNNSVASSGSKIFSVGEGDSNVRVYNDIRSPIFYDLGDTAYYADPNSRSVLFSLNVGSATTIGTGKLSVFAGGASGVGWSTGFNLGDASNYTSWIQDGGVSRFRNFGTGGMDYYSSNATQIMSLSDAGILTAPAGSMRSPIFYDSQDTTYYVDPSSSGVSLRIAGAIQGNHVAWTGEHNKIQWHSTHMYFQNMNDGIWIFRNSNGAEPIYLYASGYGQASGSWRAPIFYDSNDTSYYVDPNGTSELSGLSNGTKVRAGMNIHHHNRQGNTGDTNYWVGSQGWGESHSWNNALTTLGSCFIDIWGSNRQHPQGNNYVHAQGLQILHYRDGGGGDTSVSYGWQMVGAADAGNRWWLRGKWGSTIRSWYEIVTYGINVGGTLYPAISYDSDNTGYYVDANSTSRMGTINADVLYSYGNVTAYSDERLKKDWETLPINFVEELAKIKSGTYTRIDSGERQVGVGAQSLQAILKEAVSEKEEYLGVHYGNAAMASAVELAKEVVNLKELLTKQQKQIEEQNKRISFLENK